MKEFCVNNLKPKDFFLVFEANISRLTTKNLDFIYAKHMDKWKLRLDCDGIYVSTIWLPSDIVWRYYRKCYNFYYYDIPF